MARHVAGEIGTKKYIEKRKKKETHTHTHIEREREREREREGKETIIDKATPDCGRPTKNAFLPTTAIGRIVEKER